MEYQHYKSDFFTVPRRIMDYPDLKLSYLKVYYELFRLWNSGHDCFLSNEELMNRTGIKSESTIRDAFVYFTKKKELIRKYIRGKRYLIQLQPKIELSTEGAAKSAGGSRHLGGRGAAKSAHNNIQFNNKDLTSSVNTVSKKKKKKKPIPLPEGWTPEPPILKLVDQRAAEIGKTGQYLLTRFREVNKNKLSNDWPKMMLGFLQMELPRKAKEARDDSYQSHESANERRTTQADGRSSEFGRRNGITSCANLLS